MEPSLPTAPAVTLDNCDQEPIHIPGAIQPHGVMLVFGETLNVVQVSANTAEVIGLSPQQLLGKTPEELFDGQVSRIVRANQSTRSWRRLNPLAAVVNGKRFDAIVHRSDKCLVIELEAFDLLPQGSFRDYATDSHLAMLRLQGAENLPELFQGAAEEVRRITGYDRVMVYQFDQEGHGQVVAEDRLPSLEPFLGLHYPASDIPAQARRLYLLNWLRIIADIGYQPAALLGAPGTAPLDMSFAVLRSVSPVHIEYLKNMGVGASMSVSLVVGQKLWGLIACHHYSPKFVPFSARLTCELMGQTLSTLIASQESAADSVARLSIAERRLRLVERATRSDYIGPALVRDADDLLRLVHATGAAVVEAGRITMVGDCPTHEALHALAQWIGSRNEEVLQTKSMRKDYPDAPSLGPQFAGMLAVGFPANADNLVMWFRPEVARTVAWAGNPEKQYEEGPLGPRLTPRGSFKLWQALTTDQCEPWSQQQVSAAQELRGALVDLTMRKALEADRTRDMLLGMVGHDLRDPLGAITASAALLNRTEGGSTKASARIAASSDRMGRMIEQLLDYTRAKNNQIELQLEQVDLEALCRELVEEITAARPDSTIELQLEPCTARCDSVRMAQVVSNLLSNARHHGDPSKPIKVSARSDGKDAEIRVTNSGTPISPDLLPHVFAPFRREQAGRRQSSHGGLGLGLFIVNQVVEAHGGKVAVESTPEAGTTFTVRIPRA